MLITSKFLSWVRKTFTRKTPTSYVYAFSLVSCHNPYTTSKYGKDIVRNATGLVLFKHLTDQVQMDRVVG